MDGRRWRIEGGFGLDRLTASAVTIGDPAPGRCAVELRAWSLNFRDLLMARGQYDPRLALPYVPLSDAVGVVVAVGDGVTRVAVGDRVCPTFSPGWLAGPPTVDATRVTRGGPIPGVLSTCVDLDAGELVHPPAHLTDVEAATLPCAGVTAWHAVV
ncbi:MAG: alcohol dehydrogenase catalytic domain-containing protein, partial [Myxococcota bacterium]